MSELHLSQRVDRPADEAMARFAGPVPTWMPVVVGPDAGTWRVHTQEALTDVQLVAAVGSVWVLPDGAHHRRLTLCPDPTAEGGLVTAGLTPAVEGDLRLEPTEGGRCRLVFEGRTRARSAFTGALERLVVGDALGRSGLHDLLGTIADALATGEPPADPSPA